VSQEIVEGDWVLVCETNEKGQVIVVLDKGERFMVKIEGNLSWPFPKTVHVMVEKIRKIKPPKKKEAVWYQVDLFGEKK
jgi:hypothetical protein